MKLNNITKEIFTIDDFWSIQKCNDYIKNGELIGYEPATVTTDKGTKRLEEFRNNDRIIYKDFALANEIWKELEPFALLQIGNSKAIGLNELFRFYKYQIGQQFKKHRDQSFIRNEFECSYFTFMIYLNDNYEGGETTFNHLLIKPKQGMALLFLHDLEHEGTSVTNGIKYVLRTDVMYRFIGDYE
jgi:prolyl 4-hydroxylase